MSTEQIGSRESFNRDLTGQKSDIGMKVSARFIRHLAGPVWVGAEPHGVVVIRDGARIDAPPGELMRPSVAAIYGCNLTVELHFPKVREK